MFNQTKNKQLDFQHFGRKWDIVHAFEFSDNVESNQPNCHFNSHTLRFSKAANMANRAGTTTPSHAQKKRKNPTTGKNRGNSSVLVSPKTMMPLAILLLCSGSVSASFGAPSATRFAIALGRSGLFLRPFHHHFSFTPAAHLQREQMGSSSPRQQQQSRSSSFARRHTTCALRANIDENQASNAVTETTSSLPTERPILALIDAGALLGFAAIGKASHSAVDGSLDLVTVATTAFPFLASWFLTSPLTGVYAPSARNQDSNLVQDTLIQTAKGWALAIPLGCVLRGIMKGYVPPTSFVIVTLIATLVILTGTRVLYAVVQDFFVELVN